MSDTTNVEGINIEQRSLIARYTSLESERFCQLQLFISAVETIVAVVISLAFLSVGLFSGVTTTQIDTLVLFITPIVLFYHAYGRYDLVKSYRRIADLHSDGDGG